MNLAEQCWGVMEVDIGETWGVIDNLVTSTRSVNFSLEYEYNIIGKGGVHPMDILLLFLMMTSCLALCWTCVA